MRLFLGMILGALLTVGAAYIHDTGSLGAGTTAERPMVNWDVVDRSWQDLRSNLRVMGDRLHDEWTKRAG
jgi:hypothetical protein